MGILCAVVNGHYMFHRIRVETQEFIRQYQSDPAMYRTLRAPAVFIPHCILHIIRVETQEFNRQYHSDPAIYSTITATNKASFST